MSKIALIITNLGKGGAEKWASNISRLLSEEHVVHVFIFENVILQELSSKVNLHIVSPDKRVSGAFFYKWNLSRKLKKMISSLGPFDLVISTLPYCDGIVKKLNLKKVYYRIANQLSHEIASLPSHKAARRQRRYEACYGSENLIVVSEGVKADMIKNFACSEKKISRLYNPIDIQHIRKCAEFPCEVDVEDYVIYSGRFSQQKRIDVLLRCWKEFLRRANFSQVKKLVMLTDPHEDLRKMIVELNLDRHVTVLGFQKNPYPWMKKAKALVLSSDREGMPNVLLEALSLKVPVVSTRCPSGPEELLAQNNPECLSICDDPIALCDALERVLNGVDLNYDEILKPFSPSVIVESYKKLI